MNLKMSFLKGECTLLSNIWCDSAWRSFTRWTKLCFLFYVFQGGVGLVILFCVFILHQFPSDFMGALEKHCQAYNNLLYSRDELFVWQKQLIYNTQSTKNVLFKVATILNGKKKCQRTIWYKLQGKKPNTYSQGEVIDYFFFFFFKPMKFE